MSEAAVLEPAPVVEPGQAIDSTRFPSKVKRPRKRINKALAGVLAATTRQTWDEIAPQVGSASGNALKTGMLRSGVTMTKARAVPTPGVVMSLTQQVVSEASSILRERMNGTLLAQAGKLAAKPVGKLASKGQGEAAVLKTLAETWRTLNGNPDQISITFKASALDDSTPQVVGSPTPIDVESSPA